MNTFMQLRRNNHFPPVLIQWIGRIFFYLCQQCSHLFLKFVSLTFCFEVCAFLMHKPHIKLSFLAFTYLVFTSSQLLISLYFFLTLWHLNCNIKRFCYSCSILWLIGTISILQYWWQFNDPLPSGKMHHWPSIFVLPVAVS